jgi:hypothetical protein
MGFTSLVRGMEVRRENGEYVNADLMVLAGGGTHKLCPLVIHDGGRENERSGGHSWHAGESSKRIERFGT